MFPEWTRAACREPGVDRTVFFPEWGNGVLARGKTQQAKAICASCEVQDACLEYGLSEEFGIWGGKTRRERTRLVKLTGEPNRPEPASPVAEHS